MITQIKNKIICFIKCQIGELSKGDVPTLLRKSYILLFIMPIALVIILLVRVSQPLLLIRFGPLRSDRFGHFIIDPEIYLCKRDAVMLGRRPLDIFYHTFPICNQQIKKMWNRTLRVFQFAKWIDKFSRLIPGGEKHIISIPEEETNYQYIIMSKQRYLSFTSEEEDMGYKILQNQGVPRDTSFICFFARDSAYLNIMIPNRNWNYHNYRDSNIDNYLQAAEELASRGYYIFRMGAIVNKSIKSKNARIIDYAKEYRSDFMDVFLSAKCWFFLGDTSGVTAVARVFRRPIAYVNFVGFGINVLGCCNPGSLFIPKKILLKKEQRFLSFREIIKLGILGFGEHKQYEESNVEPVENTPEEITSIALEMDDRLQGKWHSTQNDEDLQRHFWSIIDPKNSLEGSKVRIGRDFLVKNRELLN